MNSLIVFYLMISAIHSVPVVVITLCLQFDGPSYFFPEMLHDRVNPGHRRNGISRFEAFSQALNSYAKEYLATFSLVALLFQLLTMAVVVFAVIFDVTLPFLSDTDVDLTMDVINELLKFVVLVACIQLIPLAVFSLALFFKIPIPFLPASLINRAPMSNEITNQEQNSEEMAFIRLTRSEDSENIFIYANCHDDHLGEVFKLIVCQGKEAGAKPQYFLYNSESNLEEIQPASVTVNQLNQFFSHGDVETTV